MAAVRRLVGGLRQRVLPPPFSILWDEPLRIVSVGAGPGTDLFGILMALSVPPQRLSFTRIDIHKKWKDYYEGFRQDFREQVPQFGPVLKDMDSAFIEVDLKDGELQEGKCGEAISQAHVVVLNRVYRRSNPIPIWFRISSRQSPRSARRTHSSSSWT